MIKFFDWLFAALLGLWVYFNPDIFEAVLVYLVAWHLFTFQSSLCHRDGHSRNL